MDERRRSRSPGQDRPRKTGGGFRWKDKRRDNDSGAGGDERRLERGYRDRGDRPRSPRRERERDAGRQADRYKDSECGRERTERDEKEERRRRKREKREREAMTAAQSSEPMIVVNVNDRLGTKAAIPCLASDPISLFPVHLPDYCVKWLTSFAELFKAQVAARIGREPHEILLKRQGERPFKDQLTLEDYGVSNGVQLDL